MEDLKIAGFLSPYVRFFNASPESGSVDFYSGNNLVAAGIPFGGFSGYVKTDKGRQGYKVTKAGKADDVLAQLAIDTAIGEVYTVAAVNQADELSLYGINEPTQKENMEYGHIRICALCPSAPALKIYADKECILSDINYLEISKYIPIIPAAYKFNIQTEDGNGFLNTGTQVLKQGKFNTLYIIGPNCENCEPSAIFTIDAASYNGFYL